MGGASAWTDILVEEMRQLWAAGLSASVIAKQLGNGISRCAVIGKAHRLGLPPHKQAASAEPPTKRTYKKRGVKVLLTRTLPPEPEPIRPPRMRRLPLVELEDGMCRWGVGDPRAHFYFCAADTEKGCMYCPYHLKRSKQ